MVTVDHITAFREAMKEIRARVQLTMNDNGKNCTVIHKAAATPLAVTPRK